jgi:uncharacterized lipoprotein YbaY
VSAITDQAIEQWADTLTPGQKMTFRATHRALVLYGLKYEPAKIQAMEEIKARIEKGELL